LCSCLSCSCLLLSFTKSNHTRSLCLLEVCWIWLNCCCKQNLGVLLKHLFSSVERDNHCACVQTAAFCCLTFPILNCKRSRNRAPANNRQHSGAPSHPL
jgi:hypothetical protein